MKTHRMIGIVGLVLAASMSLPAAASPDADVDSIGKSYSGDAISLAIHQETSKGMASEPRVSMLQLEGAIDMSVRAKMFVSTKSHYKHIKNDGSEVEAASLTLYGVYRGVPSPDGRTVNGVPENQIFGEATPGATIQLTIVNPDAHRQFEIGKEYYVDFSPVTGTG